MHCSIDSDFTVFEDAPGYWFVPRRDEAAAKADPERYRGEVYATKIAACRAALERAVAAGQAEVHLHGMGSTTSIKREARGRGVRAYVYVPSISTRIAPVLRSQSA